MKAVVFDFTESRGGEHARDFLGIDTEVACSGWHGTLVCDDYLGDVAVEDMLDSSAAVLTPPRDRFPGART